MVRHTPNFIGSGIPYCFALPLRMEYHEKGSLDGIIR